MRLLKQIDVNDICRCSVWDNKWEPLWGLPGRLIPFSMISLTIASLKDLCARALDYWKAFRSPFLYLLLTSKVWALNLAFPKSSIALTQMFSFVLTCLAISRRGFWTPVYGEVYKEIWFFFFFKENTFYLFNNSRNYN